MIPSRVAGRTPTEAEVTFLPDTAINTEAAETVRLFNVALKMHTQVIFVLNKGSAEFTGKCMYLFVFIHAHIL